MRKHLFRVRVNKATIHELDHVAYFVEEAQNSVPPGKASTAHPLGQGSVVGFFFGVVHVLRTRRCRPKEN
ncbi:hypothetical protein GGP67_003007 [Salinibacter ruber]|nr:hypothetical protein [Salinibacter ruber]